MSMQRQYQKITFLCDGEGCNEEFDGESDQFRETVAEMKRNGWRVVKEGDDWCHYCPTCGPKGEP